MFQRKIVLLGDPGVGKTSLVRRYIYDTFQKDYMTTLGVNFYVRTFEYPDAKVKLLIWDIAGQKSRRQIGLRYLQGASGALLTYDLSNHETFDHLTGIPRQQKPISFLQVLKQTPMLMQHSI